MTWPMVELGELVTIKGGGTPSKSIDAYWGGDVPWASVKDFKSRYIRQTQDYITQAGVENSATNIIPEGVIVIPTRMALGKVAITACDMAINQDLKALFVNDECTLDRNYLARYLESKANHIESEGKGATVKGITLDFLKSIKVPLPPLVEQKRIAAILDKADAIRQKRQQAIALADQFLRSVFLDMFGDMFSTIGYQLSHKKKIKQITTYIDYRGKTPEKSDSGIPLITAKNVKVGYISEEPKEFIPTDNYTSWMTRGKPESKDVLFTTEAPLGNVALLGTYEKVAIGQRIVALRPKDSIRSEYLMFSLLHPFTQGLIESRSSGSTAKGIRTKELYDIEIPLAELSKQDEFAKIYWYIISMANKISESDTISDTLTNALSSKAFSGQL